MGTPFNRPAPVQPATEAQITRALLPMLSDRRWHDGPVKHVERAAVLKLVLTWAADPSSARQMPTDLTRIISSDEEIGVRANKMLAHLAASQPAPGPASELSRDKLYAPLTREGASALIDWLGGLQFAGSASKVEESNVTAAKQSVAAEQPEGLEGLWVAQDGRTIKVQAAKAQGSGNLYAKLLNPATGKFDYVSGLISEVRRGAYITGPGQMRRMTLEEAAQYGHLYGRCVECGRTLTDEDSIAAGIGPVCAGKWG